MSRRTALLLLVLFLAACGGGGGEGEQAAGTASLWITKERGEQVLLTATVPAGISAMEALRRHADVETRYGGRFVESIDGLESDLGERRDWIYFVNGIDADRSASDYTLRDGDVEWWDYRSWEQPQEDPIVVGAFPEPFLHGYDGRRRDTHVRYSAPGLERGARSVGRLLRAKSVAPRATPVPDGAHLFLLVAGPSNLFQATRENADPDSPVQFVFGGDAERLARNPELVRFRFSGAGKASG